MPEVAESAAPIFIVGVGRSGTTLLRNILNRHPRIAISDETHFHHYVYSRRRAFGDLSDAQNRRRAVDEYLQIEYLRVFAPDRTAMRARLLREATSYRALFTAVAKNYSELQGKQRWGEKTPNHTLLAETLCEWYPGATLIHMVRDPRDVVASLQRMPWGADSVVRNAWAWLRANLAARRCCDHPQYLLVRYETLVGEPEREVARICERLGEEYSPSMLDATEPAVSRPHVPWMERASEAVTSGRLERWREELTAEEASQIEWAVGDHLEAFGYQHAAAPASFAAIAGGLGFAAWDGFRTRLEQLPSTWYRLTQPTRLAKEEYWIRRRITKRQSRFPGTG